MAFDLHAIQRDIVEYLRDQFDAYKFYRNTIPEDLQVPRAGMEANPFFIVQFGQLYTVANGRSIVGARNDDYSSWVNIIGTGSVDDDVASALSLVVDRLIGYKPVGATRLIPDGGPADFGSRQYSVRPVLYYASQRFTFNITQKGLDGFLSA